MKQFESKIVFNKNPVENKGLNLLNLNSLNWFLCKYLPCSVC